MSAEKKPPAWATVVGILGVCFGALGLMGGAYELMMPMMLSMQKKMMAGVQESIKNEKPRASDCGQAKPSVPTVDPGAAFKAMDEFMTAPPWYEQFAYVNGGLQLLLAALYILAAVFLLVVKRGAATFFMGVASISALRNLVAIVIGVLAGSFFAFWTVASGATGFLIDLVLIVVVAVSDRSPFRAQPSE